MDIDLKQELAEHQTLQDGIIKKLRESIKKQEAKENPFKLLRVEFNQGYLKCINPAIWSFVDVYDNNVIVHRPRETATTTINKGSQKDNDYQKILDYLRYNSVQLSDLVNDWDKYNTKLKEVYIVILNKSYIKFSDILYIEINPVGDQHYLGIGVKDHIYQWGLLCKSDDSITHELQKLCTLLSQ